MRKQPGSELPKASSGWAQSAVLFAVGGSLLHVTLNVLVPAASAATGAEPVLFWFLFGGLVFILPLVIIGIVLLGREGQSSWRQLWCQRLRFRPMSKADWLWTGGAMVGIAGLSLISLGGLRPFVGDEYRMFVVDVEPLTSGRYWILAAWLPFFVANILGEEFLWRGVLLPRQEVAFGRHAWLINGVGHCLLHLPMGLPLLLTLWPTTLILPFVVQKRQNASIGVVIHAALNGFGFLAVLFGLV